MVLDRGRSARGYGASTVSQDLDQYQLPDLGRVRSIPAALTKRRALGAFRQLQSDCWQQFRDALIFPPHRTPAAQLF